MPYAVTSLAALGCAAEVEGVLAAVVAALQAEWQAGATEGFARVLQRWAARGPALGSGLVVQLGATRVRGPVRRAARGRRAAAGHAGWAAAPSLPAMCSLAPTAPDGG